MQAPTAGMAVQPLQEWDGTATPWNQEEWDTVSSGIWQDVAEKQEPEELHEDGGNVHRYRNSDSLKQMHN